jgi:hypothetical protein
VDRARAIEAFSLLLDALFGASPVALTYDADRLPAGTTRDAYLRRHRTRVRDGVPGWSRVGAGRVVTAEAWAADVASETRGRRRAIKPTASNDVDDELDEALGIRTRRAAR